MPRRTMFASLLFAAACSAACSVTACSAAYADQPIAGPALPAPHIALSVAQARLRAPYEVQILRDDGEAMPTYAFRDRFYVQGSLDERYVIRIANPTAHRVEAVVSVDGLDVIDGDPGDLRKRGYVVPAYGETRIEGFRTSTADVATFRFSSVGGSYAGQKGKARNVGVIAVALFEEQAPPEEQQIIVGGLSGDRVPPPRPRRYDYRDDIDLESRRDVNADARPEPAPPAVRAPAPAPATASRSAASAGSAKAAKRVAEAPAAPAAAGSAAGHYAPPSDDAAADEAGESVRVDGPPRTLPQRERLGLGTEFGEQRYSAASYTRFVRAPGRPVAIAELRYNDAAGLTALGIPLQPMPDDNEIMQRESADPFPGDRFARPAR